MHKSTLFIMRKAFVKRIFMRDYIIPTDLVGLRIEVYNGLKFVSILIRENMVGAKFGEFVATRKHGGIKKKAGLQAVKAKKK